MFFCEQHKHSHKLTIQECLFLSFTESWLTKIIYYIMANHQSYNCGKKAVAYLYYTKQINTTNPHEHKTNSIKTKTTEGRSKQSSFCFESNNAAGVVTFSWVQSSDRSVNEKKRTESREGEAEQAMQNVNLTKRVSHKKHFYFCNVEPLEMGITHWFLRCELTIK